MLRMDIPIHYRPDDAQHGAIFQHVGHVYSLYVSIPFASLPCKAMLTYQTSAVGSFCVAGSIFAFLFIPELKGKTLEQMDEVFGYAPENHTLTKSRSDSSLREEKGKSSQTEDV
jgi:hypothetical protein